MTKTGALAEAKRRALALSRSYNVWFVRSADTYMVMQKGRALTGGKAIGGDYVLEATIDDDGEVSYQRP